MRESDSHESYQVAAGRLHWVLLGLFGALFVIVLAMYWLARPLMEEVAQAPRPALPPAPRLQADPAADLAAVRGAERAKLETYEWRDPQRSVARIPIERAMQLLAQSPAPLPRRSPQSEPQDTSAPTEPSQ